LATSLELFMLSTPSPSEDPDLICCKHPHPIKLFLSLCFCKFKGLWSIFICENKRFVIHYDDRYLFFFFQFCWENDVLIKNLCVNSWRATRYIWFMYVIVTFACMYMYMEASEIAVKLNTINISQRLCLISSFHTLTSTQDSWGTY
jgi:hypothetical protein